MPETTGQLEALHERLLRRIEELRIAGRDTRHTRAANLQAIQGLVNGEPHYTFGIHGVERFRFEEVLDAVSSITRCSRDPAVTTGGGYISPASTLKGLEMAAGRIGTIARRGGTFLMGTGHAGSLLLYYIELARLIRSWGGQVLEPERGAVVPPSLVLDYIGGVAVTTDGCSLMHTHDYRAMALMLEAARAVDLVVADHGYAGAAINAGVPVVAAMDTNDPALAVAKRMGADVVIVPADDNRPLSSYVALVEAIRALGAARVTAQGTSPSGGMRERLHMAERLVAERAGPAEALDELVLSLAESYRDQFFQTHFASESDAPLADEPLLELVVYKHLHDALLRATLDRLRLAKADLVPEEIIAYLEHPPEVRRRRVA